MMAYGRKDALVIAVANWWLRTFLSLPALAKLDHIYRAGLATGRPIPPPANRDSGEPRG
jgi:hypothetical protein